jgi:sortase B
MKKLLCLLMTLLMLPAAAEAPLAADAMSSEEVHAVVEALFLAAAGTQENEEIALWKKLSPEEQAARSAENAAYRAQTLPWLAAVFAADIPAREEDSAWTLAAGIAAFEGNPHGQAYLALLGRYGASDAESCMALTRAAVQRWLAEIDHEKLLAINGDYQLWLYAPGTPIDYPVVQCRSNSYYLDRMFNRKKNPAGTLFVDMRNLPGFRDPNTIIYGHHMRDGSMFHSLTDYDAPGFYEAHPFMLAVSETEIYLIEVFAGYVTTSKDHCYDIAISDEDDMRAFVEEAQRKSDFVSHVEIDCRGDRLVTLSTCAYNFDNARCIVIGKLTRVWQKSE